jgi:hypothetical protein
MQRTMSIAILAAALLATGSAAAKLKDDQVLTRDNWTALAGFAPDASPAGFTPGALVDKATWRALATLVPEGLSNLIESWGLTMRTQAYRPIHPSAGYIDATNRYSRCVTAKPTGGKKDYRKKAVAGYVAGLPFPDPQSATEIAYNQHYAYMGDDGRLWFEALWISARNGVWRTEEWVWNSLNRAMHRTDLAPLPAFPTMAAEDIQYASIATARTPADKRGTTALYYRFETPVDQQGWAWVPSMRRDLKMLFGVPGVSWNNSDMLWEDVRGYSGHPEWLDWKLVERTTILAPMHAGVVFGKKAKEVTFDLENAPHWNPRISWEPRPVYVLEGRPKMSSGLSPHPYSKVVMYVDAETWLVPLKVAYDKKGKLWKVILHAFNESPDADKLPPPLALALAVDLKGGSATAFAPFESSSNLGMTAADFVESRLRALGQ